jgi:hypothetical protein
MYFDRHGYVETAEGYPWPVTANATMMVGIVGGNDHVGDTILKRASVD